MSESLSDGALTPEETELLEKLAELILLDHVPESSLVSSPEGGHEMITCCAGCGVDLDEDVCLYLEAVEGYRE